MGAGGQARQEAQVVRFVMLSKGKGSKQHREVELVAVITTPPGYHQAPPPHFEVPRSAPMLYSGMPYGGGYQHQLPPAGHPAYVQQMPQAQSFQQTSFVQQQWPQHR